jgi:predicted secreted protein
MGDPRTAARAGSGCAMIPRCPGFIDPVQRPAGAGLPLSNPRKDLAMPVISSPRLGALAMLSVLVGAASAQMPLPTLPPQNVLSLSAQATLEVPQDQLSIAMSASRDGSDSAAVQTQLRLLLDGALAEARKVARPGALDVRTGQFSIYPRYAPKGGIAGWQGSAELVIEGKDMAAISQLAGRLTGLTVARVGFGLSREAREQVEAEVASQAIGRFRARADAYARQFGFAGYTVREVSVGGGDTPPIIMPAMRVRAMSLASAGSDESQPVEAGKAAVTVSVTGSIQMLLR